MPFLKTIQVIGDGEHISWEEGPRSREQIVLGPKATPYLAGTVLGKQRGNQAVAVAARNGNTGNGSMSAPAVANSDGAGRYSVTFTSATAFNVEDAQGDLIGAGAVGAAFNKGGVQFTITAGGTAFAAGDGFDITVSYGAGTYVPLNPAANDGSQIYAGVLFASRPSSTGNQRAAATVRSAIMNGNKVTYDIPVTVAQLANAEAQAASIGIITQY